MVGIKLQREEDFNVCFDRSIYKDLLRSPIQVLPTNKGDYCVLATQRVGKLPGGSELDGADLCGWKGEIGGRAHESNNLEVATVRKRFKNCKVGDAIWLREFSHSRRLDNFR